MKIEPYKCDTCDHVQMELRNPAERKPWAHCRHPDGECPGVARPISPETKETNQ